LTGGIATAQDQIIESRVEGQNYDRYREVAGSWIDSRLPHDTAKSAADDLSPQAQVGARKHVFSQPNGPAMGVPAAVRFAPKFDAPGKYWVYTTWPRSANAAPVTYTIRHANGEDKKLLAQAGWGGGDFGAVSNANYWIPLGEYEFRDTGDNYVELSVGKDTRPTDPTNTGQVYADAVRFTQKPLSKGVWTGGAEISGNTGGGDLRPTSPVQSTPAASGPRGPEIAWMDDLAAAQLRAGEQNRRVLVFFTSPDSSVAKHFEDQIFANARVRAILNERYVCAKVDFSKSAAMAYKLQVFRAGVVNVYNSNGSPMAQFLDRVSAEDFAAKLP
jgi:hypothetical protein